MTLWHWLDPVLQGAAVYWLAALPVGKWIERVTERRHRERLAQTERLAVAARTGE